MKKCTIKKKGLVLGILFTALTVICLFWKYVIPSDLVKLHVDLLRMMFIGFSGYNVFSIISALIQSFVWGYIIAGIFISAFKFCCRD